MYTISRWGIEVPRCLLSFYMKVARGSCSKKPGEISGLWFLATATRVFNHLNRKYKYVTFYLFDLQTGAN